MTVLGSRAMADDLATVTAAPADQLDVIREQVRSSYLQTGRSEETRRSLLRW
jgi:hypothetical protein